MLIALVVIVVVAAFVVIKIVEAAVFFRQVLVYSRLRLALPANMAEVLPTLACYMIASILLAFAVSNAVLNS